MKLFSSYPLGDIELNNRLVMSPMTRCRAIGNTASPLMAEYYRQRANAGLIVTEGTSPSPNGLGYARIPGLFKQEQAKDWKQVTDAVHKVGGKIYIQLMHTGRVSHQINMPEGAVVLAPSAVPFSGDMWTDEKGLLPCSEPRAMSAEEVETTIGEYVQSSKLAIKAGFDGVELHSANGYLANQFLDPATNHRQDDYGGSLKKRNRFVFEVAKAVTQAISATKTGIRLSPHGSFNDMSEYPELTEQYGLLATGLGALHLAYLHMVDHSAIGQAKPLAATIEKVRTNFRSAGGGAIILSGGYEKQRAEADLQSGAADLIAFGRPFISNPDLVERLRLDAALATPDDSSFYIAGEEGYTDYPTLKEGVK